MAAQVQGFWVINQQFYFCIGGLPCFQSKDIDSCVFPYLTGSESTVSPGQGRASQDPLQGPTVTRGNTSFESP